ncbi:MAG: endonuclease/exonuclease/phosphatase family protein [Mediterranea sp.]|jgi:endonuclease/exonuclease/phosphatase family metal-dependent hydrolase|nr:endonuclease/exonuclease/phosphatase family protein [Mediterranea sp.]
MKATLLSILTTAAVLMACNDNKAIAPSDEGNYSVYHFVTTGTQGKASTRIYYANTGTDGAISVAWDSIPANEQLTILGQTTPQTVWSIKGKLEGIEQLDAGSMKFEGEIKAGMNTGQFYYLYPYFGSLPHTIDFSRQVEDCKAPLSHLAKYDVMMTPEAQAPSDNFALSHLCTLLKFDLTLPKSEKMVQLMLTDKSNQGFYTAMEWRDSHEYALKNQSSTDTLRLMNHDGSNRLTAYLMLPTDRREDTHGGIHRGLSTKNRILSITAMTADSALYQGDDLVDLPDSLYPGLYYAFQQSLKLQTVVDALTVSPSQMSVDAKGGEQLFEVTSKVGAWKVDSTPQDDSANNWIDFIPATKDKNTFTLSVGRYAGQTARTGIVTLHDEADRYAATIKVKQDAMVLKVTPSTIPASSEAKTYPVTIESSFAWTAAKDEATWYSLTPTQGEGNGQITVSVEANTMIETPRTGYITLTTDDNHTVTIEVKQEGLKRELSVSPIAIDATEQSQDYTVSVNSNFAWNVTENADWLSVSATSGNGKGTFTIHLDQNTSPQTRKANVTLSAEGVSDKTIQVSQAGRPYHTMNIMSFNIRYKNSDDKGDQSWSKRRGGVKEMLNTRQPVLIGMQEVKHTQKIDVIKDTGYNCLGVDRDKGKDSPTISFIPALGDVELGEYVPLFYSKDVIVNDWGYFWMSDTPDKPSRSYGDLCNRIVTWGKFTHYATGLKFIFISVHLDHSGNDVRQKEIKVLVEQLQRINPAPSLPVIMVGDFNTNSNDVLRLITNAHFQNVRTTAKETDNSATFNGFGSGGSILDQVFITSDFTSLKYKLVKDSYGGLQYISDHWPIEVTLGW